MLGGVSIDCAMLMGLMGLQKKGEQCNHKYRLELNTELELKDVQRQQECNALITFCLCLS